MAAQLDAVEWGEFRIGDLFDIQTSKKRFDANKVTILESEKYPYVVRTAMNNGIRGYIDEDEQFLNEGNTISFGQDTATMFYQEKPYFTGDKIKVVKAKNNLLPVNDLKNETLEQENKRLKKELAILKQEKEILKKAAAYFAKETL